MLEWTKFEGFGNDLKESVDDAKLLRYIRLHNPHLTIERIDRRWNVSLQADEQWASPISTPRLAVRIVDASRDLVLRKATAGSPPERQERFIKNAANRIVVAIEFTESFPGSQGAPVSKFEGVKVAESGSIFAINPNLHYVLAPSSVPGGNGTVSNIATEVFLLRVQRVR